MKRSVYRVYDSVIMRRPLLFFGTLLISTAFLQADKPNVLFICVDDLRPEVASFGADYIHSPHMDRLATEGRPFDRHYVQAPTCGASRYALLTGQYGPAGNDALMQRADAIRAGTETIPPSLPAWFRSRNYTTVAIGKVSHYPGGRAGKDWNDPEKMEMPDAWDESLMPTGAWQHPLGAMHGLANGEIRKTAGDMDVYQAYDGDDMSYPDGLIRQSAVEKLAELAGQDQPFFLAVGFIRPHLPFGAPKKYLDLYAEKDLPPIPYPGKPEGKTTWHGSGEFMKYHRWDRDPRQDTEFAEEVRRHYAASVSYIDAQIGYLLEELNRTGLDENTIIILWGDHGWHLGEHAIWGKHSLFEESLRAPLIIHLPGGVPQPGEMSQSIVETIDLYPTLCELAGLEKPSGIDGTSLVPQIQNPNVSGGFAISYHLGAKATVIQDSFRLIAHGKVNHYELYDHASPARETRNSATQNPEKVQELLEIIQRKHPESLQESIFE